MQGNKQSNELDVVFLYYIPASPRKIRARLYGYSRRSIESYAKWNLLDLVNTCQKIKDDYLLMEDIAEAIGRTTRALEYWKYHRIIPEDFTDYMPGLGNQIVFWRDRALYLIYFFNYIDRYGITTNGEVLHTYCSKIKDVVFSSERAEQTVKEVINASKKEKSEKTKNKKSRGQG